MYRSAVFAFALICVSLVGKPQSFAESVAVTPVTPAVVNNGPFALGWSFTVNQPISVTALGAFDVAGNGQAEGQLVRLYDRTNDTILTTATLSSAATPESVGGFNVYYQSVPALLLTPGTEYIAAISDALTGDFMTRLTPSGIAPSHPPTGWRCCSIRRCRRASADSTWSTETLRRVTLARN